MWGSGPSSQPYGHFCGRRAWGRGRLIQAERPARNQETGGGRSSQTSLATSGRASALFLASGAAKPAQPRRQALVWELQTPRGGPCAHYWLPLRAHCGGGATPGGSAPEAVLRPCARRGARSPGRALTWAPRRAGSRRFRQGSRSWYLPARSPAQRGAHPLAHPEAPPGPGLEPAPALRRTEARRGEGAGAGADPPRGRGRASDRSSPPSPLLGDLPPIRDKGPGLLGQLWCEEGEQATGVEGSPPPPAPLASWSRRSRSAHSTW